jgi:hypothetical protein
MGMPHKMFFWRIHISLTWFPFVLSAILPHGVLDVIVDDEIQFLFYKALVIHGAASPPPPDRLGQSVGLIWLTNARLLLKLHQVSKHPAASRLGAQR